MRLMWALGILIIIALSLAGEWLLAISALTVGILDHLYESHLISEPPPNPPAPRGESKKEKRAREQVERREREAIRRAAREQARREREQEQQRAREEEQDDESDDSGPISFFGGPMLEGRGLPTLEDALVKMRQRVERQEEREKAAAAAKQRGAAKDEGKGEGSKISESRCAETDQRDREEGHHANYATYRRKGPGAR